MRKVTGGRLHDQVFFRCRNTRLGAEFSAKEEKLKGVDVYLLDNGWLEFKVPANGTVFSTFVSPALVIYVEVEPEAANKVEPKTVKNEKNGNATRG